MNKFLFWITGFMPMRVINDGDKPYLERYYLCTFFGWRFYIHRFVASDPDRGLHDHPWSKAFSIILSGWYWEETRSGTRKVHLFNSLVGDTFHRVVLPVVGAGYRVTRMPGLIGYNWQDGIDQPCWTLFFHSTPDVKPWGFMRPVKDVAGVLYKPNQGNHEGVMVFEPYPYQHEQGKKPMWWKTAKRRGEV